MRLILGTLTVFSLLLSHTSSQAIYLINFGISSNISDSRGNTWFGFAPGKKHVVRDFEIENNPYDFLYKSETYGSLNHRFKLTKNGLYTVRLHFCEAYSQTSEVDMRVFDISINNKKMAANFDIFSETKAMYKPIILEYPIHVTNKQIQVQLLNKKQNALINGLEIIFMSESL